MQTIRELIDFLLQQDRSIVFGNLGRYPQLLVETFLSMPSLRVVIITQRQCSSTDNRIRIQRPTDPVERCDLLVYFEPASLQWIEKHPMASRIVIFTSHYTFSVPSKEQWIDVCYFHGLDRSGTRELLQIQDFPIQTRNVGLVKIDHTNIVTLSGKADAVPPLYGAYVIVDLTRFNKDTLSLYLAFWDAFDILLEHKALIDRWVICFSDNGRQAFVRFTQKVIDALFCRTFEHGNAKEHRDILSLLPFYQSGTIDKSFQVKLSSFGGVSLAIPKTIEEACKMATVHNALPFVKNVLWIFE